MAFNIVRDDLAHASTDAIVLPTDEQLSLSGGVSATLARKAGIARLGLTCRRIGSCPTGSAVSTPAFALPAKRLIFAVGPIWQTGSPAERELLRSAYEQALQLAAKNNCRSVALPLISAGTFGCPASVSLQIGIACIKDFLQQADLDITLYVFGSNAFLAAQDLMDNVAAFIDDHYVDEQLLFSPRREYRRAAPAAQPSESAYLQDAPCCSQVPPPPSAAAERPTLSQRSFGPLPSIPKKDRTPRHAHQPSFGQPADLQSMLDALNEPFSVTLMQLIDERGLTDAEVYRRANMSRQLFSKIRSNPNYRPTKKTVLALCVALQLTMPETRDLLDRAGFSLTHASKFDVIVEYFISSGNYDIFDINQALFYYDQQLLG